MGRPGRSPYRDPGSLTERPTILDLIASTDRGLYCAAGDFHIDPWRPVPRAIITHAHSDHARFGAEVYVCHRDTAPILTQAARRRRDRDRRLWRGSDPQRRRALASSRRPRAGLGADPRRAMRRGLGRLGRLQARERWRLGALRARPLPRVHHRIRPSACRSTAGARRPRFSPRSTPGGARTPRPAAQASSMPMRSARRSGCSRMSIPRSGRSCVTARSRRSTRSTARPGVALPPTPLATDDRRSKPDFASALIVAPPSAAASPWLKRFGDYSDALASGWMQVRGNRRRRGLDRGFALSDHADWPGLLAAIEATGAERVLVTHGSTAPLTRYLREKGLDARRSRPLRRRRGRGDAERRRRRGAGGEEA